MIANFIFHFFLNFYFRHVILTFLSLKNEGGKARLPKGAKKHSSSITQSHNLASKMFISASPSVVAKQLDKCDEPIANSLSSWDVDS